jgi:rhodanese-related sulfurtransferase
MTRTRLIVGAGAVLALAVGAFVGVRALAPGAAPWMLDPGDPRVTLEEVEREVERRYRVREITSAALAGRLAAGDVVLFDVRTEAEFRQGHLPGAIRVDPHETPEGLVRAHGDKLRGKVLVFYCAVGVRSSDLMVRAGVRIGPDGPAGPYNLRGGIFRWVAEGNTLVAADKPGSPHPYDEHWGRLLARTVPDP